MNGDTTPEYSADEAPPQPSESKVPSELEVSRWERLLAGLQVGVAAFFVSIVWLGFISRLEGKSEWTIPNLMAGLFYGLNSFRPEFHIHTWAGLALHMLNCAALGMLAGQAIPVGVGLWRSLAGGVLISTAWFYLWDGFFWRPMFPPFAIYSKRASIFFGYTLIGLCLGLYSIFVRSLRAAKD